ncbi:HAD-IA family hydrolase [Novosphingobium sp. G106]|uniref:HAD-IA family hydrolase n=1 Tax=Novosphingobium sp. G106 TaxID=2849500 RepID=UPI001C2DC919|nr:HAD-IA family hydrolase [Novosphingobium sp. G106]MBV1690037.1 HAD-IA family hydrolase [Novosphingobium sp. G106]
MNRPAALLFDLDGTLVDSAVTITLALSELSAMRGGGPADVARVRRLVSKGAPALVRETLGLLAGDSEADVAAFRAILTRLPPKPEIIFSGVIDALTKLTSVGHACAVVTNKPEQLARLLLEQLDLAHFFGAIVGGDTLAVCKPDPAPLRHALQGLAGRRDVAIMIGDSDIDARAATAAGLRFALFLGGYEPDRCANEAVSAVFARFDELPTVLHRLVSDERAPQVRATG